MLYIYLTFASSCYIHTIPKHVHTWWPPEIPPVFLALACFACLGWGASSSHCVSAPLVFKSPKLLTQVRLQSLRFTTPPTLTYGESSSHYVSASLASLEFGSRKCSRISLMPHSLRVRLPTPIMKNIHGNYPVDIFQWWRWSCTVFIHVQPSAACYK